ncbi:MAG: hypothetical protein KDA55_13465, partial [Planctomycetales bacterium]|nr:hypothetical protein [Planctomycetales bacterium]
MLDQAFESLKSLNWGSDPSPLTAIDDAIAESHGNTDARKDLEQRLLAFVTGDSTEAAKDYAFRQLFLVAGPASVETLGGLLTNHRWSHMAR